MRSKIATHFKVVGRLDEKVAGKENEQNRFLIQVNRVFGHQTCNLQCIRLSNSEHGFCITEV